MSTISKENYLKAVYSITENKGGRASTTEIAGKLGVSNAAVSEMSRKLLNDNLVKYAPYKGVALNLRGRRAALKVVRRHRLWELFLLKVLSVPLEEIHDEAEILEHHSSDRLINRIDKFMNFPSFDPHGDPIPKANGKIPVKSGAVNLLSVEEGNSVKIVRIGAAENEVIKFLKRNNLTPNSVVRIIHKLKTDNSLILKSRGKEFSISSRLAAVISVVPIRRK